MSAALGRVGPAVRLARIQAELLALQAEDLTGLCDDEVLDYGRQLERTRRLLPCLDHRFIGELEGRDLPAASSVKIISFLRGLLRLDPHEASQRVKAAHAAGPRRALTGQPLPPTLAEVAAAQAEGVISERHARIIAKTIDKLPDRLQAEFGAQIEQDLVGYAGKFDPHHLARLAEHVRYCYDPDGQLADVDEREKGRGITVNQRPDGSCSGSFEGSAEFGEFLLLTFDALGKPKPAIDGFTDPRSAAQRRHDALLEALKLNVRAQQLPSVAGVTATIVLTMTAQDYEARKGLARTSHGALIPVNEAMRISAGEYRLLNVVIDKTKAITAYSSTARLFTENQRLARAAIDGGCTFPHCPAPPGWCELDHLIDWAQTRITRIDLGGLACRTHNNHAKKQGWHTVMINGRVGWIPPPWIDPEQKPRYNHLHDTESRE